MPRFHFHIVDGVTVHDPDGLVFPDEAGAKRHAEYLAAKLKEGRFPAPVMIRVIDERGRQLFEVRP